MTCAGPARSDWRFPSKMTDAEAIALEDIPMSADELDPVVAMKEANYRMKRVRDLLAAKAVVDASYRDQIGEITVWHTQEAERFDKEIERQRGEMLPYVRRLVASEPTGKKSVNLVAGVAGFRAGRERVVVEDEAAAIGWLAENAPNYLRTKQSVDVARLKQLPFNLDAVSGIRVERGDETFYTDVVKAP